MLYRAVGRRSSQCVRFLACNCMNKGIACTSLWANLFKLMSESVSLTEVNRGITMVKAIERKDIQEWHCTSGKISEDTFVAMLRTSLGQNMFGHDRRVPVILSRSITS